jgi:hypothetical protein
LIWVLVVVAAVAVRIIILTLMRQEQDDSRKELESVPAVFRLIQVVLQEIQTLVLKHPHRRWEEALRLSKQC